MRADRMRWDGLVDHTWRGEPHPTLGRHPHEFRLVEPLDAPKVTSSLSSPCELSVSFMFRHCLVTLPMFGESLNIGLGIPLGALGNLSRMTDSFLFGGGSGTL